MAFVFIQFFRWDRQTELCQTIIIIIGSHCPKTTNARDKRVLVPLHLLRLGLHGLALYAKIRILFLRQCVHTTQDSGYFLIMNIKRMQYLLCLNKFLNKKKLNFLAVLNFFKPSNKIEIIDKHGYRFINLFISSQHFCVQVFI